MPTYWEQHPTDPTMRWWTNAQDQGMWIRDPNAGQIPLNQALGGFLQTPQAQQTYSNTLTSQLPQTSISSSSTSPTVNYPVVQSGTSAPSLWPTNNNQITLGLNGQTQTLSSSDYAKIGQLTGLGWLPQGYSKAADFRGGQMFYNQNTGQWEPLNVVLGGNWSPDQRAALAEFMQTIQSTLPPTNTNNQYPIPGSGITKDTGWEDVLARLMNRAETIGNAGAAQFDQLNETLNKFLAFSQSNATSQAERQRQIADMLLGKVTPALDSAISGMNQGLSPQARAALDTIAFERLPQMFDRQEQDMRTSLMRRGAMGGDLPASAGDYVREFGGLEAEKERTISNLLSQNVLANEQALNTNRDRGLAATGLANALMGTTGAIFSPNAYLNASGNTLSQLLGAVTGQNNAQLAGLGIESQLAQALVSGQQESLWPIILSSLLGAAGSNIDDIISSIGGLFGGNKTQ